MTIEELNATWEAKFMAEADTAEVWTQMKAKGARGVWTAPIVLQPGVSISRTEDGVEYGVDESEFYTFTVSLGREALSERELGGMNSTVVTTSCIIEAAKVMELRGIDVGYPL